jgi:hypothetical protein
VKAEVDLAAGVVGRQVEDRDRLLGRLPQRPRRRRPLTWRRGGDPQGGLLGGDQEAERRGCRRPYGHPTADRYQQGQAEGKEVTPPAMTTSVVPALPWLDVG